MNRTLHFNFPLYENNDVPSILSDYNTTITEIDRVLYTLSIASGDSEEYERELQNLQNELEALSLEIESSNSEISRLSQTVAEILGSIQFINNKIDGYDTNFTNIFNQLSSINNKLNKKLDKIVAEDLPYVTRDNENFCYNINVPYEEAEVGPIPESLQPFFNYQTFLYTGGWPINVRVTLPNGNVETYSNIQPKAIYNCFMTQNQWYEEEGGQEVIHNYWAPTYQSGISVTVPTATQYRAGTVKVGEGLSVGIDGTLSVSSAGGNPVDTLSYMVRNNIGIQDRNKLKVGDWNISALYATLSGGTFGIIEPGEAGANRDKGIYQVVPHLDLSLLPNDGNLNFTFEWNEETLAQTIASMFTGTGYSHNSFGDFDKFDNMSITGLGQLWYDPIDPSSSYGTTDDAYLLISYNDLVDSNVLTQVEALALQNNCVFTKNSTGNVHIFRVPITETANGEDEIGSFFIDGEISIDNVGIAIRLTDIGMISFRPDNFIFSTGWVRLDNISTENAFLYFKFINTGSTQLNKSYSDYECSPLEFNFVVNNRIFTGSPIY